MDRKKASDFHPEVLKLFHGYVHGALTRREFLDRIGKYAVGGVTAMALFESLRPNYAWAQQVKKDDPRIKTSYADYESPQGSGKMRGYLALPAKGGKAPALVVIHENRGLNPYIEDVARRLAVEGYVALAPDALTPLGGYPGDDEKAGQLFRTIDEDKMTEDLLAACGYVRSRPECNGRWGAIGFCYGGGIVNEMAVRYPDMRAGVPFYGRPPKLEDVPKIKAAMQMHFAGNDTRLNATVPAFEAALKSAGVKHDTYIYPNTEHGFHNDTTPRYDEAAAKLAWSRALGWFKQYLA